MNEGLGRDFYKEGNSLKRWGPFIWGGPLVMKNVQNFASFAVQSSGNSGLKFLQKFLGGL